MDTAEKKKTWGDFFYYYFKSDCVGVASARRSLLSLRCMMGVGNVAK